MTSGPNADPPAETSPDPSLRYGLIGALRFPAHEVQLGRVLHALCRADERVANAFCALVLDQAARDVAASVGRRARAHRGRLGDRPVHSTSEQDLFGASEGVLSQRARRQGRIDLSFEAGADWTLGVELKLNDRARRGQQERYPRVGRPVVFLVRDPDAFEAPVLDPQDAKHYLGVVAWESLLDGLRSLPVGESDDQVWQAVLSVCELNGDFARRAPRAGSTRADASILAEALPGLRQEYTRLLGRKHKAAGRRFAEALVVPRPYAGRTWASVNLWTPHDRSAALIEVRHTESSQPVFRVSWYRHHPIIHRKEYARLSREGVYALSGEWWSATGTVAPAAWRSEGTAALTTSLVDALEALVRTGVMGRLVSAGR